MEMIKRRYGWMLRVGGHIVELTHHDALTLADLLQEANENCDEYEVGERIAQEAGVDWWSGRANRPGSRCRLVERSRMLTMKHLRALLPNESIQAPVEGVNVCSLRVRLAEIKKKEGQTYRTHCDNHNGTITVTRIS